MCIRDSFNAVSGHFNMQALLNCEDVDCIAGPVSYNDRNEGGIGAYMSAAQSVLASGKLWFDESDYRTPVSYTHLRCTRYIINLRSKMWR